MAYDVLSVFAVIVSVSAIVASLALFYLGQKRSKKTEQARICREIWSLIHE